MNLASLKAAIRQAKLERVSKAIDTKIVPTEVISKICSRIKCIDCKLCK